MIDYKKDANFIWADLSALDLKKARSFYKSVFGWTLHKDTSAFDAISDEDDQFGINKSSYYGAFAGSDAIAGIFDMPPFFRKIKMPSFWMSYLSVNDIQGVVDRARKIKGVVIEVEPSPFYKGQIALIRDPAGAGFTVYEGPEFSRRGDGSKPGHVVWNELIVDSVKKVKPFYEKVFGFKLERDTSYKTVRYKVLNPAGEEIAGIEEVDQDLRGDKVYWVPFFSVESLDAFSEKVNSSGGQMIYTDKNPYGSIGLVTDPQSGSFGVIETGTPQGLGRSGFKYRTAIALLFVALSIAFNWQWFWGIAFLAWIYPDLKSGQTYFVEPIDSRTNPVWFWLIMLSWIAMSLSLIFVSI
ncbi:MAG: VOC family protein [Patescibacteria group bacterium]